MLLLAPYIFLGAVEVIGNYRDGKESQRAKVGPPFENAAVVIRALDAYKSDHGRFPHDLSALEASDRPPPLWGVNEWDYEGSEDSFSLTVRRTQSSYTGHVYFSDSRTWRYDQ